MHKKLKNNKLLVGLDIGTAKVIVVVAELLSDGNLDIIGFGSQRSHGVKKGKIINAEGTVTAIRDALETAEASSGCQIHSAYISMIASENNNVNLANFVRKCDLEIDDLVLSQLASSYAVLTEEERQLGVCLLDIGAGTTDVVYYSDGIVQHTFMLPVAGEQITNDIAVVLQQSNPTAEMIKLQYACAYVPLANEEYILNLEGSTSDQEVAVTQQYLAKIIESRYSELFELVNQELKRTGLAVPAAGFVLTGGSSKMLGVREIAENIFQNTVRIGVPPYLPGLDDLVNDPCLATGIGLLLYGSKDQHKTVKEFAAIESIKNVCGRVKHWFQGNF